MWTKNINKEKTQRYGLSENKEESTSAQNFIRQRKWFW